MHYTYFIIISLTLVFFFCPYVCLLVPIFNTAKNLAAYDILTLAWLVSQMLAAHENLPALLTFSSQFLPAVEQKVKECLANFLASQCWSLHGVNRLSQRTTRQF